MQVIVFLSRFSIWSFDQLTFSLIGTLSNENKLGPFYTKIKVLFLSKRPSFSEKCIRKLFVKDWFCFVKCPKIESHFISTWSRNCQFNALLQRNDHELFCCCLLNWKFTYCDLKRVRLSFKKRCNVKFSFIRNQLEMKIEYNCINEKQL